MSEYTTVKVSKEAMDILAKHSKPFESRRACIDRMIVEFDKREAADK